MGYQNNTNNRVVLCGTMRGEFSFTYERLGEKFYSAFVFIERLSGNSDILPIIVPESLFNVKEHWNNRLVCLNGEMRSYNKHVDGKSRLLLYAFAKYFAECGAEDYPCNNIFLDGYVCKPPVYRETPFGREITDVLLAVNRPCKKSDYMPCIFWGNNAVFCSNLKVGSHIKLHGRIQSREYLKRISDEQYVQKTAYEVSAKKLEVINDVDKKKN